MQVEKQEWAELLRTGDAVEIQQRRDASIEEAHAAYEQQRAARVTRAAEQKKCARYG